MHQMIPISDAIHQAVERSFPPEERQAVLDDLAATGELTGDYVRAAILAIAFGNKDCLKQLVVLAQNDFRGVVIQLEYPQGDLTRAELARRYHVLGLPIPPVLDRFAPEESRPRVRNLNFIDDTLSVELLDGRVLSISLNRYPRLLFGTKKQRDNWRLIGENRGIHWPDLDEDISVESLLSGKASSESIKSLQRWVEQRNSTG